ncbi:MAG: tetratricopeptide repeat protein [Spirochaetes bacterium]|nr:tetratricopeptide repeat protein [Spirochaetota bacterium]
MKKLLFFLFLLLFAVQNLFSQTNTLITSINEIKKLLFEKKINEALQYCDEYILAHQEKADTVYIKYEKALIYSDYIKDYDNSIAVLKSTADDLLNISQPLTARDELFLSDIYWLIGYNYRWHKKDYNKAVDYFIKIIQDCTNSPKKAEAQYSRSWCLALLKRYKDAGDNFKIITERYSNSVYTIRSFYEAGECYQKAEKYPLAKLMFETLITGHPQNEWAIAAKQHLKWIELNYTEEE